MNNDTNHDRQQIKTGTEVNRPDMRAYVQKTVQLGQLVLDLYQKGELAHTALVSLCAELVQLESQVAVTAVSPAPTGVYKDGVQAPGILHCPQCNEGTLPSKKFCTNCGYQLVSSENTGVDSFSEVSPDVAQDAVASEAPPLMPSSSVAVPTCMQCHEPLEDEADFCIKCGAPVRNPQAEQSYSTESKPAPPPVAQHSDGAVPQISPSSARAAPVAKYCDNCGLALSEEVTICPVCQGTQFAQA